MAQSVQPSNPTNNKDAKALQIVPDDSTATPAASDLLKSEQQVKEQLESIATVAKQQQEQIARDAKEQENLIIQTMKEKVQQEIRNICYEAEGEARTLEAEARSKRDVDLRTQQKSIIDQITQQLTASASNAIISSERHLKEQNETIISKISAELSNKGDDAIDNVATLMLKQEQSIIDQVIASITNKNNAQIEKTLNDVLKHASQEINKTVNSILERELQLSFERDRTARQLEAQAREERNRQIQNSESLSIIANIQPQQTAVANIVQENVQETIGKITETTQRALQSYKTLTNGLREETSELRDACIDIATKWQGEMLNKQQEALKEKSITKLLSLQSEVYVSTVNSMFQYGEAFLKIAPNMSRKIVEKTNQ